MFVEFQEPVRVLRICVRVFVYVYIIYNTMLSML